MLRKEKFRESGYEYKIVVKSKVRSKTSNFVHNCVQADSDRRRAPPTCFWCRNTFLLPLPSTPSDTTSPGVSNRQISEVYLQSRGDSCPPCFSNSGFTLFLHSYLPPRWRKAWTCATYGKLRVTLFLVIIMIRYPRCTCVEIELLEKIFYIFLRRISMHTSRLCGSELSD